MPLTSKWGAPAASPVEPEKKPPKHLPDSKWAAAATSAASSGGSHKLQGLPTGPAALAAPPAASAARDDGLQHVPRGPRGAAATTAAPAKPRRQSHGASPQRPANTSNTTNTSANMPSGPAAHGHGKSHHHNLTEADLLQPTKERGGAAAAATVPAASIGNSELSAEGLSFMKRLGSRGAPSSSSSSGSYASAASTAATSVEGAEEDDKPRGHGHGGGRRGRRGSRSPAATNSGGAAKKVDGEVSKWSREREVYQARKTQSVNGGSVEWRREQPSGAPSQGGSGGGRRRYSNDVPSQQHAPRGRRRPSSGTGSGLRSERGGMAASSHRPTASRPAASRPVETTASNQAQHSGTEKQTTDAPSSTPAPPIDFSLVYDENEDWADDDWEYDQFVEPK